jgi:hypothetical protein
VIAAAAEVDVSERTLIAATDALEPHPAPAVVAAEVMALAPILDSQSTLI